MYLHTHTVERARCTVDKRGRYIWTSTWRERGCCPHGSCHIAQNKNAQIKPTPQEDLEDFEVKEGIAMAEAEDKQGSGPGVTVSALVKAAVDGSLAQAFSGESRGTFGAICGCRSCGGRGAGGAY